MLIGYLIIMKLVFCVGTFIRLASGEKYKQLLLFLKIFDEKLI